LHDAVGHRVFDMAHDDPNHRNQWDRQDHPTHTPHDSPEPKREQHYYWVQIELVSEDFGLNKVPDDEVDGQGDEESEELVGGWKL
jgi:hypothetical protein